MLRILITLLSFFSSIAGLHSSFAFEHDGLSGYVHAPPASSNLAGPRRKTLPPPPRKEYVTPQPELRVDKFNHALTALGVPLESRPLLLDTIADETVDQNDFEKNLQYIDGFGPIRDYLHIHDTTPGTAGTVELYQDLVKLSPPETYRENFRSASGSTQIHFRHFGPSIDSPDLISKLNTISCYSSSNPTDCLDPMLEFDMTRFYFRPSPETHRPLSGLKVAIDPGHMGGTDAEHEGEYDWDHTTGKYVHPTKECNKDPNVTHPLSGDQPLVSEANLNLHTALLLAKELEAFGAEVRLTRYMPERVTHRTFAEFKNTTHSFFRNEHIYEFLDSALWPYSQSTAEVYQQKLSQEIYETDHDALLISDQFYTRGEDLQARQELIDQFKPDITFDLHYDADDRTMIQNYADEIKTYVPGGFMNNPDEVAFVRDPKTKYSRESGSRETRALALKHLLEPRRWNESVKLAESVVLKLSEHTHLPLKTNRTGDSVPVSPGVFARNLFMTLHSTEGLMVYLEPLNYDFRKEFYDLANEDRPGIYEYEDEWGVKQTITFNYSTRLEQVALGIRDGVLHYFETRDQIKQN